ncbi:amino acid ABC transporter permease [Haloplasma contractile]|uniref:ABC transporter substrate binding protein-glutamine transport n=1 Tax=Haloplasma contractile SSD-17B TaxID=1033810 RepID=U2FLE2_9MOLU|nr:amino acid ABC transporter permease [Haloplasma contractile]ERJ12004.1 ABC transporter substrate binding protein-glutamine transport [Haloplasma contractile SSD-17B]
MLYALTSKTINMGISERISDWFHAFFEQLFPFLYTDQVPEDFFKAVLYLAIKFRSMFFEGTMYTLLIALTGTLLGLIIAVLIVPLKIQVISKRDDLVTSTVKKIGVIFSTVYVDILRGTPMIVQAVVFYYGSIGLGLRIVTGFGTTYDKLLYGIIIVSINTSAYIIEVLRGSINAIDKGQMEAARSIGMTRWQAMMNIIIPQALKNSVPAIGNEFVINIKDTSVLMIIPIAELFFMTTRVNGVYYRQTEGFFIATIIYLILTLTTTRLLYFISSKIGVSKGDSYPTSQSFIKKVFNRGGINANTKS